MCRKDVAQICAVQDILHCRKNAHPDTRSVLRRDELAGVEEHQPSGDGKKWQKELPCDGYDQARQKRGGDGRLEERTLSLDHA